MTKTALLKDNARTLVISDGTTTRRWSVCMIKYNGGMTSRPVHQIKELAPIEVPLGVLKLKADPEGTTNCYIREHASSRDKDSLKRNGFAGRVSLRLYGTHEKTHSVEELRESAEEIDSFDYIKLDLGFTSFSMKTYASTRHTPARIRREKIAFFLKRRGSFSDPRRNNIQEAEERGISFNFAPDLEAYTKEWNNRLRESTQAEVTKLCEGRASLIDQLAKMRGEKPREDELVMAQRNERDEEERKRKIERTQRDIETQQKTITKLESFASDILVNQTEVAYLRKRDDEREIRKVWRKG